jgi:hypothetical protein
MTKTEALQTIVDNQDNPSLNYAINYAKVGLQMSEQDMGFETQILYVLSNLSHWRANKKFSITKETIKEVKETLKESKHEL